MSSVVLERAVMNSAAADRPLEGLGQHHAAREAWFCVRSHPKHEHIAAAHLARIPSIQVFHPRIRVRRKTRTGSALFRESLFPGYLFARFHLELQLAEVRHTPSVSSVVQFGDRWPVVPDHVMQALIAECQVLEDREDFNLPQPGQWVEIVAGSFSGLSAQVLRVQPAAQRVVVLMEFLGRTTPLELSIADVVVAPSASGSRESVRSVPQD